jgi:hypothetical protein
LLVIFGILFRNSHVLTSISWLLVCVCLWTYARQFFCHFFNWVSLCRHDKGFRRQSCLNVYKKHINLYAYKFQHLCKFQEVFSVAHWSRALLGATRYSKYIFQAAPYAQKNGKAL